MALALCIAGIGAYSLKAAERVDTEKTVTITAKVVEDGSGFATNYKGDVVINLYKIATMDEGGALSKMAGYDDVDLSVLPSEVTDKDATVMDINNNIVYPALNSIGEEDIPDAVITIKRGEGEKSGTTSIEAGAGLYLFVPQNVSDPRYFYYFTPYVILAPGSEYITPSDPEMNPGQGSDKWNYDVSFNLKCGEERRYGRLIIRKVLDNYNRDLGIASFVYKIKAKLEEGTVVFDDVMTLDFDDAGAKEFSIDLPSTAIVTIKEENKGASYKVVGTDTKEITVVDSEIEQLVEFENEYDDDKLISGGISAVNTYEKIDGEYVHVHAYDIVQ